MAIDKPIVIIMKKPEVQIMLQQHGLTSDGVIEILQQRAREANLPVQRLKNTDIIHGYINKPKGAAQIAYERGFLTKEGFLANENKHTF